MMFALLPLNEKIMIKKEKKNGRTKTKCKDLETYIQK